MENKFIKNLYFSQVPDNNKKYKLNKNIKFNKDEAIIKASNGCLPTLSTNKGGSIIIQTFNTTTSTPPEIDNLSLPIMIDKTKLKIKNTKSSLSNNEVSIKNNSNNYCNKNEIINNNYKIINADDKAFNMHNYNSIVLAQNNLDIINSISKTLDKYPDMPYLERKLLEKQALIKLLRNKPDLLSTAYNLPIDKKSINTNIMQLYDPKRPNAPLNRNLPLKNNIIYTNKDPNSNNTKIKKIKVIDFSKFNDHEQLSNNEFIYCKRIGNHVEYAMCSYKDLALNFSKKKKRNLISHNSNVLSINNNNNNNKEHINYSNIKDSNNINTEYITISKNTVMHNNKGLITIYSIHEWIDYYIKYKMLLDIDLFKNFKVSKIFDLWKRLLRSTKKQYYTDKLASKLHRIDQHLNKGIFEIRLVLREMENYNIFKWELNSAVSIHEFDVYHKDHMIDIEQKILQYRERIKKIIGRSCALSYKAYKEEKKITIEDDDPENEAYLEDESRCSEENENNINSKDLNTKYNSSTKLLNKSQNSLNNNLTTNFLKDAMPYAQIATRRTHYKKLLKYIRSIDFIFNETKFNMIMQSFTYFYRLIEKKYNLYIEGYNIIPIFVSNLYPYNDKIIYNPLPELVKKTLIDQYIKETIYNTIYKQNFIDPNEFKTYNSCYEEVFEVKVEQNTELTSRIHKNPLFKELFYNTNKLIDNSFKELDKYSNSLLPTLINFNEFSNINFEDIEKHATPDDLKNYLIAFTNELELMYQIKDSVVIGIFEYNLKNLKEKFKDIPKIRLNSIRSLIPKILGNKLKELSKICNEKIKLLASQNFMDNNQSSLMSIESFIELKLNAELISKQKDSIDNLGNEIDELYNLIKTDNNIKFPDFDNKLYIENKSSLIKLTKKLDDVNFYIENKLNDYKKILKEQVKLFDNKVGDLKYKLNDEEINYFKSDDALIEKKLSSKPLSEDINKEELSNDTQRQSMLQLNSNSKNNLLNYTNINYINSFIEASSKAISKLEEIDIDLKYQNKQKKKFIGMENDMDYTDVEYSKFSVLNDVEYEHKLKVEIWKFIMELQENIKDWNNTKVLNINIYELSNNINSYETSAKVGLNDLDVIEIPQILLKNLELYKDLIPIIACIQKASMNNDKKFINQIKYLLFINYEYDIASDMFTLKKLIERLNNIINNYLNEKLNYKSHFINNSSSHNLSINTTNQMPITYINNTNIDYSSLNKIAKEMSIICKQSDEEDVIKKLFYEIYKQFNEKKIITTKPFLKNASSNINAKFITDKKLLSKEEIETSYSFIDEKLMQLKKLQANEYSSIIKNEINELLSNLVKYQFFINEYVQLQHYILLVDELVYYNTDFQAIMQSEFKKFANENNIKTLNKHFKDSFVYKLVENNTLFETLMLAITKSTKAYEDLYKEIENYLFKKRYDFAYFNLLSDEELIELITENSDCIHLNNNNLSKQQYTAINDTIANISNTTKSGFIIKAKYLNKFYNLFKDFSILNTGDEEFLVINTIFDERIQFKFDKTKTIKEIIFNINNEVKRKIKSSFKLFYTKNKDREKLISKEGGINDDYYGSNSNNNNFKEGKKEKDIRSILFDMIFNSNKEHLGQVLFNCYYSYYYNYLEKILSSDDDILDKIFNLYDEAKARRRYFIDIIYGNILYEDIINDFIKSKYNDNTVNTSNSLAKNSAYIGNNSNNNDNTFGNNFKLFSKLDIINNQRMCSNTNNKIQYINALDNNTNSKLNELFNKDNTNSGYNDKNNNLNVTTNLNGIKRNEIKNIVSNKLKNTNIYNINKQTIKYLNNDNNNGLSNLDKKLLLLLLNIDNYFLEIIKFIIREEVSSQFDFSFLKIIATKVESENSTSNIFNLKFDYGYEYVGIIQNYCYSSNTDKNFLALFNSIYFKKPTLLYLNDLNGICNNFNNSLEVISKIIGKNLITFNCSSKMNYNSFHKIFNTAQTLGIWIVFDGIENLSKEVISFMSQEIMMIYRNFSFSNSNSNNNNNNNNNNSNNQSNKDNENNNNKIKFENDTQIFLLANFAKDIKPIMNLENHILHYPGIKSFFHSVSLMSPDFDVIVEMSIKNLGIKKFKIYAKKIKYFIEYQSNILNIFNPNNESFSIEEKCLKPNIPINIKLSFLSKFINLLNIEIMNSSHLNIGIDDQQFDDNANSISNNILFGHLLNTQIKPNIVQFIHNFSYINHYVSLTHPILQYVVKIQLNPDNLKKIKIFFLVKYCLIKTFDIYLINKEEIKSFEIALNNIFDSILFSPKYFEFSESNYETYIEKQLLNVRDSINNNIITNNMIKQRSSINNLIKNRKSSLNMNKRKDSTNINKSKLVNNYSPKKLQKKRSSFFANHSIEETEMILNSTYLPVVYPSSFALFSNNKSFSLEFEDLLKYTINMECKKWNFNSFQTEYTNKLFDFITNLNTSNIFVFTGPCLSGKSTFLKDASSIILNILRSQFNLKAIEKKNKLLKSKKDFSLLNSISASNTNANKNKSNKSLTYDNKKISNFELIELNNYSTDNTELLDDSDLEKLRPLHSLKVYHKSQDNNFLFEQISKYSNKQFYNVYLYNILKSFEEVDFINEFFTYDKCNLLHDHLNNEEKYINKRLSNNNLKENKESVLSGDVGTLSKKSLVNINNTVSNNISVENISNNKKNQIYSFINNITKDEELRNSLHKITNNSIKLLVFDGVLDSNLTDSLNVVKNMHKSNYDKLPSYTKSSYINQEALSNDTEKTDYKNQVFYNPYMIHNLPSGISLDFSSIKFLFETTNLKYANPANLTSMKLVTFTRNSINENNILFKYISENIKISKNLEIKNYVKGLFDNYFSKIYDFIVVNKLKSVYYFNENFVMINMLTMFDSLIPDFDFEDVFFGKKSINRVKRIDVVKNQCMTVFIFVTAWTMIFFTDFILINKIEKVVTDLFKADDLKGPIFDYYIDEETLEFEDWSSLIESIKDNTKQKNEITSNKTLSSNDTNNEKLDNLINSNRLFYNKIKTFINFNVTYIPNSSNFVYIWIINKLLNSINNNSLRFNNTNNIFKSTDNKVSNNINNAYNIKEYSLTNTKKSNESKTNLKHLEVDETKLIKSLSYNNFLKEFGLNNGLNINDNYYDILNSIKSNNVLSSIFYHGKESQGKSIILKSLLKTLDQEKCCYYSYINNYNSTTYKLTETLNENLIMLKDKIIGDGRDRKIVFLIEDVNLQKKQVIDDYSSNSNMHGSIVEHLRQLNDTNSYYCMKNNKYIKYNKLSLISSANLYSYEPDENINRYINQNILITQNDANNEYLLSIYKPRLEDYLKEYVGSSSSLLASQYINTIINIHYALKENFYYKLHYKFHFNDITKIINNFMQVKNSKPIEEIIKKSANNNKDINYNIKEIYEYNEFFNRVIVYEIFNQYYDRFLENEAKEEFKLKIMNIFNSSFKLSIDISSYINNKENILPSFMCLNNYFNQDINKFDFNNCQLYTYNVDNYNNFKSGLGRSLNNELSTDENLESIHSNKEGTNNYKSNNNNNNDDDIKKLTEDKRNIYYNEMDRFIYSDEDKLYDNIRNYYSYYMHSFNYYKEFNDNNKNKENKIISNKNSSSLLLLNNNLISHIIKLLRILTLPKGNCIVISPNLAGKKSLFSFLSFIINKQMHNINYTTFNNISLDYQNNANHNNPYKGDLKYLNNPRLLQIIANSMIYPDHSNSIFNVLSISKLNYNPNIENYNKHFNNNKTRGNIMFFNNETLSNDNILEVINKITFTSDILNSFKFKYEHFTPLNVTNKKFSNNVVNSSFASLNNNIDLINNNNNASYLLKNEDINNFFSTHYDSLMNNINANLNVVLSIDYQGEAYKKLYNNYPQIVNNFIPYCIGFIDYSSYFEIGLGIIDNNFNYEVVDTTTENLGKNAIKSNIKDNHITTNNLSKEELIELFLNIKQYFEEFSQKLSSKNILINYTTTHYTEMIINYTNLYSKNKNYLINLKKKLENITKATENKTKVEDKINIELENITNQNKETESNFDNIINLLSEKFNEKQALSDKIAEDEVPLNNLINLIESKNEELSEKLSIPTKSIEDSIKSLKKFENKDLLDFRNSIETINSSLPKNLVLTIYEIYNKGVEGNNINMLPTDWESAKNKLNISYFHVVFNKLDYLSYPEYAVDIIKNLALSTDNFKEDNLPKLNPSATKLIKSLYNYCKSLHEFFLEYEKNSELLKEIEDINNKYNNLKESLDKKKEQLEILNSNYIALEKNKMESDITRKRLSSNINKRKQIIELNNQFVDILLSFKYKETIKELYFVDFCLSKLDLLTVYESAFLTYSGQLSSSYRKKFNSYYSKICKKYCIDDFNKFKQETDEMLKMDVDINNIASKLTEKINNNNNDNNNDNDNNNNKISTSNLNTKNINNNEEYTNMFNEKENYIDKRVDLIEKISFEKILNSFGININNNYYKDLFYSLVQFDYYTRENLLLMFLNINCSNNYDINFSPNNKVPLIIDNFQISKDIIKLFYTTFDSNKHFSYCSLEEDFKNMDEYQNTLENSLKEGHFLFVENTNENYYYMFYNLIHKNYLDKKSSLSKVYSNNQNSNLMHVELELGNEYIAGLNNMSLLNKFYKPSNNQSITSYNNNLNNNNNNNNIINNLCPYGLNPMKRLVDVDNFKMVFILDYNLSLHKISDDNVKKHDEYNKNKKNFIDSKLWINTNIINFNPSTEQISFMVKTHLSNKFNSDSNANLIELKRLLKKEKNNLIDIENKIHNIAMFYDYEGLKEKNNNNNPSSNISINNNINYNNLTSSESIQLLNESIKKHRHITKKEILNIEKQIFSIKNNYKKFDFIALCSAKIYKLLTKFIVLENSYSVSIEEYILLIENYFKENFYNKESKNQINVEDSIDNIPNNANKTKLLELNDIDDKNHYFLDSEDIAALIKYIYEKKHLMYSQEDRIILLLALNCLYLEINGDISSNYEFIFKDVFINTYSKEKICNILKVCSGRINDNNIQFDNKDKYKNRKSTKLSYNNNHNIDSNKEKSPLTNIKDNYWNILLKINNKYNNIFKEIINSISNVDNKPIWENYFDDKHIEIDDENRNKDNSKVLDSLKFNNSRFSLPFETLNSSANSFHIFMFLIIVKPNYLTYLISCFIDSNIFNNKSKVDISNNNKSNTAGNLTIYQKFSSLKSNDIFLIVDKENIAQKEIVLCYWAYHYQDNSNNTVFEENPDNNNKENNDNNLNNSNNNSNHKSSLEVIDFNKISNINSVVDKVSNLIINGGLVVLSNVYSEKHKKIIKTIVDNVKLAKKNNTLNDSFRLVIIIDSSKPIPNYLSINCVVYMKENLSNLETINIFEYNNLYKDSNFKLDNNSTYNSNFSSEFQKKTYLYFDTKEQLNNLQINNEVFNYLFNRPKYSEYSRGMVYYITMFHLCLQHTFTYNYLLNTTFDYYKQYSNYNNTNTINSTNSYTYKSLYEEEFISFDIKDLQNSLKFLMYFLKQLPNNEREGLISEAAPFSDLIGNLYFNTCRLVCEMFYISKAVNTIQIKIIDSIFYKFFNEDSFTNILDQDSYFEYKFIINKNKEVLGIEESINNIKSEIDIKLDYQVNTVITDESKNNFVNSIETNSSKNNIKYNKTITNNFSIKKYYLEKYSFNNYINSLKEIDESKYNNVFDNINSSSLLISKYMKSNHILGKLIALSEANTLKFEEENEEIYTRNRNELDKSINNTTPVNLHKYTSISNTIGYHKNTAEYQKSTQLSLKVLNDDLSYYESKNKVTQLSELVKTIANLLPNKILIELEGESVFKLNKFDEPMHPIDECYQYEIKNLNKVIDMIKSDLIYIENYLKGKFYYNEVYSDILEKLQNYQIPMHWSNPLFVNNNLSKDYNKLIFNLNECKQSYDNNANVSSDDNLKKENYLDKSNNQAANNNLWNFLSYICELVKFFSNYSSHSNCFNVNYFTNRKLLICNTINYFSKNSCLVNSALNFYNNLGSSNNNEIAYNINNNNIIYPDDIELRFIMTDKYSLEEAYIERDKIIENIVQRDFHAIFKNKIKYYPKNNKVEENAINEDKANNNTNDLSYLLDFEHLPYEVKYALLSRPIVFFKGFKLLNANYDNENKLLYINECDNTNLPVIAVTYKNTKADLQLLNNIFLDTYSNKEDYVINNDLDESNTNDNFNNFIIDDKNTNYSRIYLSIYDNKPYVNQNSNLLGDIEINYKDNIISQEILDAKNIKIVVE